MTSTALFLFILGLICGMVRVGGGVTSVVDVPDCFVPGECLGSFEIGILPGLDDPEQCLEMCKQTEGCAFFTFYVTDGVCIAHQVIKRLNSYHKLHP